MKVFVSKLQGAGFNILEDWIFILNEQAVTLKKAFLSVRVFEALDIRNERQRVSFAKGVLIYETVAHYLMKDVNRKDNMETLSKVDNVLIALSAVTTLEIAAELLIYDKVIIDYENYVSIKVYMKN